MDTFSSYYIRKYKALEEQIKRLQFENKLLEELSAGTMSGRPEQTSGSSVTSVSTSSGSGIPRPPQPPPPSPFNPDLNRDNTVDGADLGAFLANWDNPYGGADLGVMLANWGQNPNPTDPTEPEEPEEPSNPTNPPTTQPDSRGFYPGDNVRGTSTKDIVTLRRSIEL